MNQALNTKFPTCPFLFMYGACKRTMFHSSSIIRKIKETQGCKYVHLQCGHWLQRQYPEVFIEEVKAFFDN